MRVTPSGSWTRITEHWPHHHGASWRRVRLAARPSEWAPAAPTTEAVVTTCVVRTPRSWRPQRSRRSPWYPVRRPTHAARERTWPTHTTTRAAIARYTPHCSSTPPPPLPALVVHRPPLSTIAIAPALSRSAPPTTLAASVSAVSATHATVVAVRTSSHHLVLSTTCACR